MPCADKVQPYARLHRCWLLLVLVGFGASLNIVLYYKAVIHYKKRPSNAALEANDNSETLIIPAFISFGYSNLSLMQPMPELRPLYSFTLTPRKIDDRDPKFMSNNTLDEHFNWTMVVVVKSRSDHAKRRQIIRETWGSYKRLNGVRLKTVFVVGNGDTPESEMNLLREYGEHGDLLQINMEEIYGDVGYKTLAGMQWVSQNFPPHWIYTSADDDMVPNLISIFDHLEMLMALGRNLATNSGDVLDGNIFEPYIISTLPIHCGFGIALDKAPLRGDCKWCVEQSTYSSTKYPPFCYGGWYSLPVALVSGIYQVSRHHKYYRMDDVWITALLRLRYFRFKNIRNHFGIDDGKQNIGLWPETPNAVTHAHDENGILSFWKDLEPKIVEATRDFIRT